MDGYYSTGYKETLSLRPYDLYTAFMTVTTYRVSDRGQMALPAETRRRWDLTEGGAVEIADLGNALVIVPAGRGGLRSIVGAAVTEAGGYHKLVAAISKEESELA